jgi:hypothetical protein
VHDNIEELDDGSWKATCPFDGEEFVADTRAEALTKEGAHRAENHIDSSERIERQEESDGESIVDDWKKSNEVATSN